MNHLLMIDMVYEENGIVSCQKAYHSLNSISQMCTEYLISARSGYNSIRPHWMNHHQKLSLWQYWLESMSKGYNSSLYCKRKKITKYPSLAIQMVPHHSHARGLVAIISGNCFRLCLPPNALNVPVFFEIICLDYSSLVCPLTDCFLYVLGFLIWSSFQMLNLGD